jgi:hypothetical protein
MAGWALWWCQLFSYADSAQPSVLDRGQIGVGHSVCFDH